MIAEIIVLIVFAFVIIAIATEKINRAIVSILGSIILFIFLYFFTKDIFNLFSFPWKIDLEEVSNLLILVLNIPTPQKMFLIIFQNGYLTSFDFSHIVNYMNGTVASNFNNLHSVLLILGIMIEVGICQESGVFQYLALKLVKFANGSPERLLFLCSLLAVFLSTILNNVLTIILLIPLTIMICRILGINPIPYILSEALLVNVGSLVFIISSVPNILISQAAGLNFIDYIINIAWFALILFVMTFLIIRKYLKKNLIVPEKRLVKVLGEYNPWNFVSDRKLFYKSIISLVLTFVLIILIPDFPDMVAITMSMILIIISRLKPETIIKNIDFELILYILGIFIITGCMEYVGIVNSIGYALKGITAGSPAVTTQIVLWISAILSSSIDNIPITTALIPIMPILTFGFSPNNTRLSYFALNLGVVLGDNLTPMGDNILVMKITEQHGMRLKFMEFLKLGLFTTLIQLACGSLYFGILTIVSSI